MEILIKKTVEYIEKKQYENVAVYLGNFNSFKGELPSLEIIIPNTGSVIFKNQTNNEILRIISDYLDNIDHKKMFFSENDGTRKCDCH